MQLFQYRFSTDSAWITSSVETRLNTRSVLIMIGSFVLNLTDHMRYFQLQNRTNSSTVLEFKGPF